MAGVGADVRVEADDHLLRRQAARDISAIAPALLDRGLLSEQEYEDLIADVRAATVAPGFFVNRTVVSVWGRA